MELLGVVMESGGTEFTIPKLNRILATRACHKSVRAGDPLTYLKMVAVGTSIGDECRSFKHYLLLIGLGRALTGRRDCFHSLLDALH